MKKKVCIFAVVLFGLVCALLVTKVPMDYQQTQMRLTDWAEQYPQASDCFEAAKNIFAPGEYVYIQTCRNFMGAEYIAFSIPCLEADVDNVGTAGSAFWRVNCGVYAMLYRDFELIEEGYSVVEDGTMILTPDDNSGIIGIVTYSGQDIPCEYEGEYPAREVSVFIEKDKSAPCSVDFHASTRDSTVDPNEETVMNAVFCGRVSSFPFLGDCSVSITTAIEVPYINNMK